VSDEAGPGSADPYECILEAARADRFLSPQTREQWETLAGLLRPADTPEVVRHTDEGAAPPRR
jgi:hypothetical protein